MTPSKAKTPGVRDFIVLTGGILSLVLLAVTPATAQADTVKHDKNGEAYCITSKGNVIGIPFHAIFYTDGRVVCTQDLTMAPVHGVHPGLSPTRGQVVVFDTPFRPAGRNATIQGSQRFDANTATVLRGRSGSIYGQ